MHSSVVSSGNGGGYVNLGRRGRLGTAAGESVRTPVKDEEVGVQQP